ncbi:MAG: ABC transporter permease [Hymenobacteraceae bacterium]|nr:ABC transporter permease [Hymenobacteraceae bacterium]
MFRNYFKTAFRNLLKHKADSAINLVGLVVAFTSALLLFLSVQYEFSFDAFHANRAHIYRAYTSSQRTGRTERFNTLPPPFAPTLKAEYPDVAYATRSMTGRAPMEFEGKKLNQELRYVDPDFVRMFSFPLTEGDAATALSQPTGVVMREGAAHALFGPGSAVGKTLRIQPGPEWRSFTVTGVVADPPDNSSIRFDVLLRFDQSPDYREAATDWSNWNHQVYVQLRPSVNGVSFSNKTAPFMARYFAEDIEHLRRDGAIPDADGRLMRAGFQPLTEIHTDPELGGEGPTISKSYLYLLLTVGLLIVLIACINFVNLSIGRSFTRVREIGLRKTLGALPWQLAAQFWCEIFLICLLAFVVSLVAGYFLLPLFRQTFGMNIRPEMLWSGRVLGVGAGVFLLVTALAGGYPVWLIARLQVIDVLRGRGAGGQSARVRNALIVTQFVIATGLMICTIVAWQQISFLRSRPLGYNRHQIISIPVEGETPPARVLARLRQELAGAPGIVSLSGIYNNLGRGTDNSSRHSVMGFDYQNREVKTTWLGISHDFAQTLDLRVVAGRDFTRAIASDSSGLLINEAMAAQLGAASPQAAIGTLLPVRDDQPLRPVIGVVKDFNFESLHQPIAPLTLVLDPDFGINYILVKVAPDDLPARLELIRQTWQRLQPNDEFKGSFLDQNIERQYKREERLGRMFIAGAITAILLSCLGLLAIVILVLAQRTREIGIRKVLGASVAGIVGIIFQDFLRLVGLAILIAAPLAWLAVRRWLDDFTYRVPIEWWVFALAGGLTVSIALLTILARAVQAATANPVKSLRAE